MPLRTDLALESIMPDDLPETVHIVKRGRHFRITDITIDDDSCISSTGKGKGRYITLETSDMSRYSEDHKAMAKELSEEIKRFIPKGEVLFAGLGNSDITPDAIGPLTAAKILATRHIRRELKEECGLFDLRPVSVLANGVLGQTGIETAELVKAVSDAVKPSAIIAADALACSDISRLGTTIQISDAGISPGSGVANARKELTEKVMGIPVIAIGIPTVVDMHTIVRSLTGMDIHDDMPNMMVTPRDIDRLTERASQLLAYGINLALQPSMNFEDVQGIF
ncbi:MAG: GPR endopeptidase [Ruminococcus sp.]|nr:GPR endopeptidase [Ruminococcus sp.]